MSLLVGGISILNLVFMGTPDFAVPSLRELHGSRHRVAAVVTQPDRPRGRGGKVTFSPIKAYALQAGLEVLQPERLQEESFRRRLRQAGCDLVVTAAYGRILPPSLLSLPPLGCINLHASLLPAYRGAAPIQRAIMDGAGETGVTVIRMSPQMDAGEIILQEKEPIWPEDNAGTLHDRLAEKGARLLVAAVEALASGNATFTPQDENRVTFAPRLLPEEELLDWTRDAWTLHNHIRGLAPRPGAYTALNGRRLKIWKARAGEETSPGPGVVAGLQEEGLAVGAGRGVLLLLEVQPQDKRPMAAAAFYHGYGIAPGYRLGE